jgi:hypothetical protein
MIHFQYSVTTRACKNSAWDVFSNWRRWNQFANIYGQVRWREGTPWEPGSCMEIEVLRPVNTVINHVITHCVPAQKVGWIDHAMGIVIGQWVTFERQNGNGTRVHTWGEIVRPSLKIAGRTVEHLVISFTETWYENFRLACDELADSNPCLPNSSAGSL